MTKRLFLACLLPLALVLSARADFIAVDGGRVSRVNELTGASQILGSVSPGTGVVASLTRDSQTNIFYTVGGVQAGGAARLFTLDPNTGQTTLVAPLSQSSLAIKALAFAPNGLLYATSLGDNTLYTINPQTGQVARAGVIGSGFNFVYGLAFAPDGTLYGHTTSFEEGGPVGPGFFRLNPATAVPTVLTPPGSLGIGYVQDLAFAPDGTLWVATSQTFTPVDIQTGLRAGQQRITSALIEGFAFLPAAAVPEPSTALLLGAGLLGLFTLHRRKPKQ